MWHFVFVVRGTVPLHRQSFMSSIITFLTEKNIWTLLRGVFFKPNVPTFAQSITQTKKPAKAHHRHCIHFRAVLTTYRLKTTTDLLNFAQHRDEAFVIHKFLQLPQLRQFRDEFVANFLQHIKHDAYLNSYQPQPLRLLTQYHCLSIINSHLQGEPAVVETDSF